MALNVLPRAQGSQGKWLILAIFCQQSRKRTQRIRSPNRSFEHLLIPFGSLIHPSENHFLQRNPSIQSASTLLSLFLIPSGLIPREYIVLTMFFFFFLLFFFYFFEIIVKIISIFYAIPRSRRNYFNLFQSYLS